MAGAVGAQALVRRLERHLRGGRLRAALPLGGRLRPSRVAERALRGRAPRSGQVVQVTRAGDGDELPRRLRDGALPHRRAAPAQQRVAGDRALLRAAVVVRGDAPLRDEARRPGLRPAGVPQARRFVVGFVSS